jgi:hypothetical protein
MTLVNHNQAIFDAIAASIDGDDVDGPVEINVKKFIETFNSHRDRALCTSLLVGDAQTPAHLKELAQWADAAVELFPVHGEKFRQIAEVLRRLPPRD